MYLLIIIDEEVVKDHRVLYQIITITSCAGINSQTSAWTFIIDQINKLRSYEIGPFRSTGRAAFM